MRAPRTRFAASFVAVIAGAGAGGTSCSHETAGGGNPPVGTASDTAKQPVSSWSVMKANDGSCDAMPIVDCSKAPAGVTCNPPAGMRIACPPAEVTTIITYDGTHCTSADGKTGVACPGSEPAPPVPPAPADKPTPAAFVGRRWNISAGEGKVCWAEVESHCDPAVVHHTCNPPAPTKVTCPPYNAGNHVDELAPDKCQMLLTMGGGHCPPNAHCNPPPPREVDVPCPQ